MTPRRLSVVVALAALVWIAWALVMPPAPAAAGNILANPGFEEEKNNFPSGWNVDAKAKEKGSIELTAKAASGKRALKLAPNRNNPDNLLALNIAQGFQIGPLKGKTLDIAASLAAEGGATAVFGVWVIDRVGSVLATEQVNSTSAAYAKKTATLDVPADSSAMLLVVQCQVLGKSGAAYFDDVSVEVSTRAALSSQPGETGALAGTISIDAGSIVRRIPRTVYGQNISWTYGGNMIFDFRANAFNEEILRLTRELNVSLLRFPGGSFADFYHWRDGIGPLAARKETEHQPGDARSKHTFGTDEALTFAERTGAKLLITVNIHTGSPEEAADWVRYVSAQSPTRRVVYWEVGNESYIKNDSPANAAMPPDEYARRLAAFSRAMRAADPDIKILGIGGENFGRYTSNFFPGWDRTVLSKAGSSLDFLAVHNAYFPAVLADVGLTDLRKVYTAMLAAPVLIKGNLDTLAQQTAETTPGRRIPIAVTEWGPIFSIDPKSPWVDHVKTLGSALFVASTLKVFVEHPSVDIANAFKLNDVGFMGWIGARYKDVLSRPPADGQFAPTAPYLAMQLFTRHFGSQLVATTSTSPTFDSPALGMTAAVEGVPYLDVVSSLSDDRRTMFVIAVNKHFDRPIEARLTIRGFTPAGPSTVRTLDGSGIDANTGTQLPAGVPWAKQMQDRINPRFDKGSPDDVKVTTSSTNASAAFTYVFPPHSVTAMEIPAAGVSTKGPGRVGSAK